MKMLPLLSSICVAVAAQGQGFVNLNFENAVVQVNDPTYGGLSWSLAAPGWGHSDGPDTGFIYYRNPHAGITPHFLLMDSVSPTSAPGTQLAGNYSLAFASGNSDSQNLNSPWINSYISQTGIISPGVRSLRLLAGGAPFKVFVGGTEIQMISLGGNQYGGDITSFAGSISELRIMNNAVAGHWGEELVVDNIVFSSTAVPEPSGVALLAAWLILSVSSSWNRQT